MGTGSTSSTITDSVAATSTTLNQPYSIDSSTTYLYIADTMNNRIRAVLYSTGIITTVVGTGTAGYGGDAGYAKNALINQPKGVSVDLLGNIYLSDTANNRIRKVRS